MSLHLVIGASGQIGAHLLRHLQQAGQDARGTYFHFPRPGLLPLDLRDEEGVLALVTRLQPRIIYLPAGFTNVDRCELDPDAAYAVNVLGTWHALRAAARVQARVVYFSTDYVFDGADGPYAEDAPPRPLSEYGRQKVWGELGVALHGGGDVIVRTTVVYGWEEQGKNFVQRLVAALLEGRRVRVPHDQVGSPTYAPNLAAAVVELAASGATGVFHIGGPDRVSRYDLARAAAAAFALDDALIEPVSTSELAQPARRPLQAGLRSDKARALLSTPLLGYREGLARMAAERPEELHVHA